jgi:hypothetical protein
VTNVVERLVLAAGDGGDLLHVLQHDAGHGVVVEVGSFAAWK